MLTRPCPECGFDPDAFEFLNVPSLINGSLDQWQVILLADRSVLATRPDPATWSRLEYAAHVRDVCRMMIARLNLMLVLDNPVFPNWDQDETAISQEYNQQHPATVSRELMAAGAAIAEAFDLVPVRARSRVGGRSDGARFTVESLAAYFLHELVHHLRDVSHR